MATGRQYVHKYDFRNERKHPHQTRQEFTANFDINMQHAGQDLLWVGWLMEVGVGRNPEVGVNNVIWNAFSVKGRVEMCEKGNGGCPGKVLVSAVISASDQLNRGTAAVVGGGLQN